MQTFKYVFVLNVFKSQTVGRYINSVWKSPVSQTEPVSLTGFQCSFFGNYCKSCH